jgi:hypothetical protein
LGHGRHCGLLLHCLSGVSLRRVCRAMVPFSRAVGVRHRRLQGGLSRASAEVASFPSLADSFLGPEDVPAPAWVGARTAMEAGPRLDGGRATRRSGRTM